LTFIPRLHDEAGSMFARRLLDICLVV